MNKKDVIKYIDKYVRLNQDYCTRAAAERQQTVEDFIADYLLTTQLTTTRPCALSVAKHYTDKWNEEKEIEEDFEL